MKATDGKQMREPQVGKWATGPAAFRIADSQKNRGRHPGFFFGKIPSQPVNQSLSQRMEKGPAPTSKGILPRNGRPIGKTALPLQTAPGQEHPIVECALERGA